MIEKIRNEPQIKSNGIKDGLVQSLKIAISGGAAAVSTLDPMVGIFANLLGTAITENLPNFRQENQEQFIKQLAIDLYNLKDKINEDFLKKDEFVYLLNKCLRLALEELDIAKRRAYINILTNTCVNPENFKQIDFYLSLLISLSSLEVHTLAFFNNPRGYLEMREIDEKSVTGDMNSVLKMSFPELTKDEFRIVLKMLFNSGLTNTNDAIVGSLTATTGLRIAEGRLTESGKKLISYASDYKNRL